MVSPPPFFQCLLWPRPRARVFVRGPLFSVVSWVDLKGGPARGLVSSWYTPVVRAVFSLLRFRAGVGGVGRAQITADSAAQFNTG